MVLEPLASALAVLGTLAVIPFVLPNHTVATLGPTYAPLQLVVAGAASLVLYATFMFVQTVSHRQYFLDEAAGGGADAPHAVPAAGITALSSLLLPLALVVVAAASAASLGSARRRVGVAMSGAPSYKRGSATGSRRRGQGVGVAAGPSEPARRAPGAPPAEGSVTAGRGM